MVQETLERDEGSDTQPQELIGMQVASKSNKNSLKDERGVLKGGGIEGYTKNDAKNGAVADTLGDRKRLLEHVMADIREAKGEGEVVEHYLLDLSRAQSKVDDGASERDVTDADIQTIIWLNKTLVENEGISLMLTSLNPETEKRLRAAGIATRGLQLRTKEATTRLFQEQKQNARKAAETPLNQAA